MNRRIYLPITLLTLAVFAIGACLLLTSGQSSASALKPAEPFAPNPQWGPDIQVNATSAITPANRVNFTMAVNPINTDLAIASFEDKSSRNGTLSGYAGSTDAGRTWLSGSFTGPWGSQSMVPVGDVHVDYDAAGIGYYTSRAITSTASGYFVLTTTTGVDWSAAMPVVTSDNSQSRSDSQLAVDKRSAGAYAGSLYIFWQYSDSVPPFAHGLQMRYSRDGGRTWSADVQVSDAGHDEGKLPKAAVASDGAVYIAFEQTLAGNITEPPNLYLDRSTDGGATWGTDQLIAVATPIGAPDEKGHELVINGSATCGEIRINHSPYITVSTSDANSVYAVWNDGRWDSNDTVCDPNAKHSDIAFSRSTDGGATWSAPTRVNDDTMGNGIDQWQPAIATGPNGLVGVTWYDRRYSADGFFYDMAYSQSEDGGLTWSPNQRVSDVSSDPQQIPDVKGVDDLGQYQSLAYGPDYALPSWIDTHIGEREGRFFTDRGVFPPNPTVTPTVATTSTSTATATSIATVTPCPISFTDVPQDSAFYGFIRCLACRGVISGYADGTFKPGNNITRGQIAKMVSNAAGFNDGAGAQIFEDVPPANTFYLWINRLARRGYMSGYPCDATPEEPCVAPDNRPYFRPNANATRGQLAKIVANAAGITGTPTTQFFADVAQSHPFYLWIMRLTELGVMSGYPCGGEGEPCDSENRPYFRPFNDVTRGQSSKIVANTFLPGCQTPAGR